MKLMQAYDMKIDLHLHANFADGRNSVEEMIQAANEKGLKKVAIAEHVRRDSGWIDRYIKEVLDGRKYSTSKVLLGFETKLLDFDGTLDIPREAEENAELIICSLHRIPGLHEMEGDITISELDPEKARNFYIRSIKAICQNGSVDIIGHPFDLLNRYKVQLPDETEMHDLARYIASSGKGVEINTHYNVPPVEFIRICKSYGVKFSIGSDAHDVSRVGDVYWAIEALKSAHADKNDLMEVCLI
jgi:putative hydrolase